MDIRYLSLKQTLEILNREGINLELFEIQKLAENNICQLQERRYVVDYELLLDELFPSQLVIEQVIQQKYAWIVWRAWKRMKSNFLDRKRSRVKEKAKS